MVGIMRAPQSAYNGYRGSQVKSSGVNGVDVGGWKRLSEVAHCIFYAQCKADFYWKECLAYGIYSKGYV